MLDSSRLSKPSLSLVVSKVDDEDRIANMDKSSILITTLKQLQAIFFYGP